MDRTRPALIAWFRGAVAGLAAAAAIASSAVAETRLSIHPPAPTTDDEVRVHMPEACSYRIESVLRTGSDIRVVLEYLRCPTPPFIATYAVSLGKLPAGEYRVEVSEGVAVPEVLSFFVFEADPILTVRPFVVPAGTRGFPIHVRFSDEDFNICEGEVKCDPVFHIGGVPYRLKDILPGFEGTWFHAPDLAPGLHDVRLTNGSRTVTVPAAIYYYERGTAPDRGVFERVLFPVLFRSSGLSGSEWRAEAVISNPTEFAVATANTIGAPDVLEPASRHAFAGERDSRGIALMVPRREAESLAFRLRIRDVSRESNSFGTDVPVIRESEMFREQVLTLLDVPLDPRYRTKLRVYFLLDATLEHWPVSANVWVVPAGGGPRSNLFIPRLTRACSGASCAWTPLYGEIDIPPLANGERADVYVDGIPGGLQWAFASVTNNATHEVTLVTPDGRGGRP